MNRRSWWLGGLVALSVLSALTACVDDLDDELDDSTVVHTQGTVIENTWDQATTWWYRQPANLNTAQAWAGLASGMVVAPRPGGTLQDYGSGTLIGVNTYVTAHHVVEHYADGGALSGQYVDIAFGRALDLAADLAQWRFHPAGLTYLDERMLELGLKPFGQIVTADSTTATLNPNEQDLAARYAVLENWRCRVEYWDRSVRTRDLVAMRCDQPLQVETLSGDMATVYPGDVWGWIPVQNELLDEGDHLAVTSLNITSEVLESAAGCDAAPDDWDPWVWQQNCPGVTLLHSPTGDVRNIFEDRRSRCSWSDSPAEYYSCFTSDADTYPGSSGGGIISDDYLEVVGVVSKGRVCDAPEPCHEEPIFRGNAFALPSDYFRSRYSNNEGPTQQPFQWYPTTERGYTPESPELVSGGLIGNPSDPADTVTHICPNAGEYVAGIVGHYAQAESKDDNDVSLVVGFGSLGIVCRPDNPTTRKGYGFYWSRVFMRGTLESTYDVVAGEGLEGFRNMNYMTFRNRIVSRDAVVGTPRARERHCPPGTILGGLGGQGNGEVIGNLFDIECQTLGVSATLTSIPDVVAPNNQYGTPARSSCPHGPVIGVRYHVTSNQNVQGFELLCAPFDTPSIPL